MTDDPPALPADRLGEQGWVLIEQSRDTLAKVSRLEVTGHTVVYGDQRLREAVAAATDPSLDQPWRFFFATKLGFDPPPPPGVGPAMFSSIVRSRARDGFAERLRDRGYESVERTRKERLRVRTGERAHLTAFSATDHIDDNDSTVSLPVEGWVGVWHHNGTFRVAGGAYPAVPLREALGVDIEATPDRFRTDLFDLVREVS